MGSVHLKALRSIPGAELIAVCSRDPRKLGGDLSAIQGNLGSPGENFDFGNIAKYTEIDALLCDPRVDAVDICLPTSLHAPVAIAALRTAFVPQGAESVFGEERDFRKPREMKRAFVSRACHM